MHQSEFSYLSIDKSSSARKKSRKKLVEHRSLKQMRSVICSSDGDLWGTGKVGKMGVKNGVKLEEDDHLSSVVILHHRSAHSAYAS